MHHIVAAVPVAAVEGVDAVLVALKVLGDRLEDGD
jgi:hypothetical protein